MNTDPEAIVRHLEGLASTARATAARLAKDIAAAADRAIRVLDGGGKLMFCGNGGSAADAQHLATEYVVRFGTDRVAMPAIALTTDSSLLTAASNDLGFERVFARQLEAIGREGDLLFLHSTSGRSMNLLEAAGTARARRIQTIALLAGDGGPLLERVDQAIVIPTKRVAHAQEVHLAVGHAICDRVESWLRTERRSP